jgi:hypothetical protein
LPFQHWSGAIDAILRRIFELKKEEVTGRFRKLNNEEVHNL